MEFRVSLKIHIKKRGQSFPAGWQFPRVWETTKLGRRKGFVLWQLGVFVSPRTPLLVHCGLGPLRLQLCIPGRRENQGQKETEDRKKAGMVQGRSTLPFHDDFQIGGQTSKTDVTTVYFIKDSSNQLPLRRLHIYFSYFFLKGQLFWSPKCFHVLQLCTLTLCDLAHPFVVELKVFQDTLRYYQCDSVINDPCLDEDTRNLW